MALRFTALHGAARVDARRTAIVSALLLACLPAIGDQDARISVDVNLVVLPATVTDQKGHIVSDLRQESFQVYENGVPQQIRQFSHEDVPITAGIVVDHSSSMRRKLAEVSAAARAFAQASNREDQICVVNFNEHVELGLPGGIRFTDDPAELERAISSAPARGMTALYDAIATGLEQLQAGTHEKKVLIVISDGGDNASVHRLPQILKLAEQSSAIIYAVGIFDEDDPDRNPGVLRRLASVTGGIAFFPKELDEVTDICARIARDIRSQYSIGYTPATPAAPGEYRAVRVTARAPHHGKLTVRTRAGYRAGGPE
jgi:Ca-activated chloride channel family protein